MSSERTPIEIYVSPRGTDHWKKNWTGTLPEPNAEGTNGPLATVRHALTAVRDARDARKCNDPATIYLRGGRYALDQTLVLRPYDSGIRFAAYGDEKPIIDGGVKIEGWSKRVVGGVTMWVAEVSEILERRNPIRQLFSHGRRAERTRLPEQDFYRMESVPGTDPRSTENRGSAQRVRFVAAEGHFGNWRNLSDVEVVVLHWWVDERRAIKSFDPSTRMVTFTEEMRMMLVDDLNPAFARYYVENVFEALKHPGQWYLDRNEKLVYYIPRPGESIETAEIYAPRLEQLVKIEGAPEKERYVDGIRFEGITFEHTDWSEYGRAAQAAMEIGAALVLQGAHDCSFQDCTMRHLGLWALDIREGCRNTRIEHNTITDIGAGGVRVTGAGYWDEASRRTSSTVITDNEISSLGRIYLRAVGVLIGDSSGNIVAHNHIHDLFYTAISVGWTWGFRPNVCFDNRIEKNHIHTIGQGVLADMGGVYLLGVQPGTIVRGNLIHDVISSGYGGWGIYPDEGCSHVVIEDNIVYNTSSQSFHLHYGRENAVRNNIWAFAKEGLIAISRGTRTHLPGKYTLGEATIRCCFIFERNIVITDGQPVFVGGMDDLTGNLETRSFISDLNVFYDIGKRPLVGVNAGHMMRTEGYRDRFTWEQILGFGYDHHSVVGDPKLVDIGGDDFTLTKDSPALALGFKPIDASDVGPRSLR